MSYVFDSSLMLASSPNAKPNGDPFTPLLRAYQGDNVQVRTLVGAHVFAHQFNFAGPTWFAEPSWSNSGYRSAQAMGLSEHFEFLFNVPSSSAPNINRKCPDTMSDKNCVDYFYSPSMDEFGIANGLWGLFRSYDPTKPAKQLAPLPNNPIGPGTNVTYATCPASAPKRVFNITAVTGQIALSSIPANQVPTTNPPRGQIVFNSRTSTPLRTSGVLYVRTEDLDPVTGKFKNWGTAQAPKFAPVEPLILRANAGDCIEVNLANKLDPSAILFQQNFFMAPPLNGVLPNGQPAFQSKMSGSVGLRPQLLSYDAATSTGANVGWNRQSQPDQLAAFGKTVKYTWYAGKITRGAGGTLTYTDAEFGSLNLFPSDLMYQQPNGLFAALIIEPKATTKWNCDGDGATGDCGQSGGGTATPPPTTRAAATVTLPSSTFREFAAMFSDNLYISQSNSSAVNYRTEPFTFRYTGFTTTDFSCALSNQLVGGDPQTPIFNAKVGDTVRFRLMHTFGAGTSQVFSLHGHAWQRNPYSNSSTQLGNNSLSQWLGSRDNHGSTDHADILVSKAGGEGRRTGDYLYSVFVPIQARQGSWGIFRVSDDGATSTNGGTDGGSPANAACPQTAPASSGGTPAQPRDDLDRFTRRPLNINPRP